MMIDVIRATEISKKNKPKTNPIGLESVKILRQPRVLSCNLSFSFARTLNCKKMMCTRWYDSCCLSKLSLSRSSRDTFFPPAYFSIITLAWERFLSRSFLISLSSSSACLLPLIREIGKCDSPYAWYVKRILVKTYSISEPYYIPHYSHTSNNKSNAIGKL